MLLSKTCCFERSIFCSTCFHKSLRFSLFVEDTNSGLLLIKETSARVRVKHKLFIKDKVIVFLSLKNFKRRRTDESL